VRRSLGNAEVITIALAFLAGVVWGVRLEGRVNGSEQALASQDKHHREVVERVDLELRYIRTRLDQVLDERRQPAPTTGQRQ
jgi:hypothetical protein